MPLTAGAVFRTYRSIGRFSMIPDFISKRTDIPASAKLVYGYLVRCEGRDGAAFPSKQNIGDAVGLSVRQVQYCVHFLEKYGILKITKRLNATGQSSNLYEFIWREWMEEGAADCSPSEKQVAHIREQCEENSTSNTVLDPLTQIAEQSAPADLGRLSLRTIISKRRGHYITDGEINSMIVRATVKRGRPVTASECAAVAQVLPLPRGRAKAIQSAAWWVSAIANAFAEERSAAENYRPEDFMPSPAYEHDGTFAELLEDAEPVGPIN